jgi:hypothetical protein
MTVGELYSQVSQLGFEDALEHDDRFYFAVNRALLQVNSLRPATKTLLINHNPIKNMLRSSSFNPISRVKDITFESEGAKAYYFEADGNGVLYVETYVEGTWKILSIKTLESKGFVPYKALIRDGEAFVNGVVRLRFSGEYFYSIRNIALYEYLYSDKETDIPSFEPFKRYDMTEYTDDFIGFAESPILVDGENLHINQDYDIESASILLLPYDKQGAYKVIYKRRPKAIKNEGNVVEDLTPIDLDEELCYALPNLVAAYIWAEDEPSLAEYYLALYRERAAEIVATTKNTSPVIYKSCNGW